MRSGARRARWPEGGPGARVGGRPGPTLVLAGVALVLLAGCSVRRFAADRIGSALAASGSSWTEDDDPELVGDAFPFALKTLEGLLAESPENPVLLLGACRGFAGYAAGFVAPEAEALPAIEFERAQEIRARALRLHLRALGYCRRALELRSPGAVEALSRSPETALGFAGREDVELLYWTGAAWGSAVALGLDRPELVADLPAVRSLFERALALDPGWDRGALEEALIPLDALSPMLGGSPERARERYERAVELSAGLRASPHVTWAASAAVAAQDRRGFRVALERALAVDPDASPPDRLGNHLARRRAGSLLERADDLFFDEEGE